MYRNIEKSETSTKKSSYLFSHCCFALLRGEMRLFPDLLPFWGPYYFYFRVLIYIPLIVRVVVLVPIIKRILEENKQHFKWFMKIVWYTPGILKSISFVIPGLVIPFLVGAVFHGGKPFAWERWDQTPRLAAFLYLLGLAILWTWDYMKIRGVKAKLFEVEKALKEVVEHKGIIDTAVNLQRKLNKSVKKTEAMRAQKKLNPWQRFKGNVSRGLLSAIESRVQKEMHQPISEMRKQKLAEGLISQLFMVLWLSIIYYIFEQLFLSIIFIGGLSGLAYYLIVKYNLLADLPKEFGRSISDGVKEGIDALSSGLADEAKLLGKATSEITTPESEKKKKDELPALFNQKNK